MGYFGDENSTGGPASGGSSFPHVSQKVGDWSEGPSFYSYYRPSHTWEFSIIVAQVIAEYTNADSRISWLIEVEGAEEEKLLASTHDAVSSMLDEEHDDNNGGEDGAGLASVTGFYCTMM